jgi:hypothetical protein
MILTHLEWTVRRAGLAARVRIEVRNVDHGETGDVTGLHLGPAVCQETVEILDGYTYFRKGEAVALDPGELAAVAARLIAIHQDAATPVGALG